MKDCNIMASEQTYLHAIPSDKQFRWLSVPLAVLMLFSLTVQTSAPATAKTSLTTCIDLTTLKERISKTGTCRTPQEALAKWRVVPDDSALTPGSTTKTLTICSNKASSPVTYQLIRAKCAKHMQTNHYTRSASLPAKPVISRVISLSHESASLALAADSASSTDAPITYYTISSSKGDVKKVHSWRDLTLIISGLQSSTSYTFTVSATNADGTSLFSAVSPPVTTQIYVPPAPVQVSSSPPAPVQVSSSPPAPSCANGGIACLIGDVGPGGGRVFYVATTSFDCGPTRSESCLYLEAAPALWNGGTRDPSRSWAKYPYSSEVVNNPSSPETASATGIGWGYRNTRAIILQGNTEVATSAAALADSYAPSVGGVIVDDWYLPSKDELTQMCKWQRGLPWVSDATACVDGVRNTGIGASGFARDWYWSSTQGIPPDNGSEQAWAQPFDPQSDDPGARFDLKDSREGVRPIRAFGIFAPNSAPSFALSKTAETVYARTTPIIGYTITSSGGTITSYSISPAAPAGLTFNSTTGILSGTPTETRTTTLYTITASNTSGSATESFILRVAGSIGDLGPGGGTIFYVATTPFACGALRLDSCVYLEAAPELWNNYDPEPRRTWANNAYESTTVSNASPPETATATAIGWGYWNTRAIVLQGNTDTSSAAALADSYESTNNDTEFNDWHLPSKDELNQMCKWVRNQSWTSDATLCNNTGTINSGPGAQGFAGDHSYWSSSENPDSGDGAWEQSILDGSQVNATKDENYFVRPVRTF
jgi:hypothetical protein